MNILWVTWKDMGHPEAGGAEIVCDEICKRLVADGHEVTLLTSDYPGSKSTQSNGIKIVRAGSSRYTHPLQALAYYIKHCRNKYDIVIEEVNGGAPYFVSWFGRKTPRFMFYHQLARVNWFYEIPAPFSYIGYYLLVPIATRMASLAGTPLITVSESTKQVLAKFGFKPSKTSIISEGLKIEEIKDLGQVQKYDQPTLLSHGSMRAMKRTIDQIKAFEIAKEKNSNLKLRVSGSSSGDYGKKVMDYISNSPYKQDITYLGRTSDDQMRQEMQKCHAILVTSVEEGWGLIVTEANSQGTPAVVYDVSGLRDSVRHGQTGIVTPESPADLAQGILQLVSDQEGYSKMRQAGWLWSKEITFDKCYNDFKLATGIEK